MRLTWRSDVWGDYFGLNDVVYGRGGDDTLYMGDGDDVAYGNKGNDTIWGGHGNDTIYGGNGDDTIRGFSADHSYSGAPIPSYEWDVIFAGNGNDYVSMASGRCYAGKGNDLVVVEADSSVVTDVTLGPGKDTLLIYQAIENENYSQTIIRDFNPAEDHIAWLSTDRATGLYEYAAHKADTNGDGWINVTDTLVEDEPGAVSGVMYSAPEDPSLHILVDHHVLTIANQSAVLVDWLV